MAEEIISHVSVVCSAHQVAEEIWVCEKQAVTKWEGSIIDYKEAIIKRLHKEQKKRERLERERLTR